MTAVTTRGFTDHEMLDQPGLIHMNGRVYDPEIGRFLSADPFVQAPLFSQSYNRYSYVFNNPLSFVDPSGFNAEDDDEDGPGIHIGICGPYPAGACIYGGFGPHSFAYEFRYVEIGLGCGIRPHCPYDRQQARQAQGLEPVPPPHASGAGTVNPNISYESAIGSAQDQSGITFGFGAGASASAALAEGREKVLLPHVMRNLKDFLRDLDPRTGAQFRALQVDLVNASLVRRTASQLAKHVVFLDIAFSGVDALSGRAGFSKVGIAVAGAGLLAVSAPIGLAAGATLVVLDTAGLIDPFTLSIDSFVLEALDDRER